MSNKSSELRSLSKRIAGVTMPIRRKRTKWSRNWPCLCGSDNKYKNCCLKDIEALTATDGDARIESVSEDIQKMIDAFNADDEGVTIKGLPEDMQKIINACKNE